MKSYAVVLWAVALLSGCASYPESTLETATPEEARCAAIRAHIPLNERGTAADPTTDRTSLCTSGVGYPETRGPGVNSALYPFRAVFDAAVTD